MQSWVSMMAAGAVALVGGLCAVLNPARAGVAATTIIGWALLMVAAFQAWTAYRSQTTGGRLRAGSIGVAALFLGLSALLGPFGSGALMRWIVGFLLLGSGGAKAFAAYSAMPGEDNQVLVYGAAAVSVLLGLVVLFGINLNFGVLLALELLVSGLGLILLAMHRRRAA